MPLGGQRWSFTTKSSVDNAEDVAGVYELWDGDTLIYIGSSSTSIRARLQSHFNGYEGACTQAATAYKEEPNVLPLARERELLTEYQAPYFRLPRCNDRIP